MKILVFSDLHQGSRMAIDGGWFSKEGEIVNQLFKHNKPDAVVITGDVYESNLNARFIYKDLSEVFPNVPVICCLGNHEFFFRTVEATLANYKKFYEPEKYNVHYLDIIDKYDIGGVRFIGNSLMYDGSLCTVSNQILSEFANHRWMDCTIKDFDFKKECNKNIAKIRNNIDPNKINILCTHCVPHNKLNGHMFKLDSPINAYSGVANLLDIINIQYSFSGHTHWKIEETINNCKCYNIGNDYYCGADKLLYKVVEV